MPRAARRDGCALRAGARWKHIKTALFFTGPDVRALLATPEQRRATLASFAPPRVSNAYIEGPHRESHAGGTLREIVKETVDLVD